VSSPSPSRGFGSSSEPLTADANGHFRLNNIFAVPFRIDAEDPINPDLKGSFNGVVGNEGQLVEATIVVGGAGTGSIQVTVVDPNKGFAPVPNAEVSLYRGTLYDFASTDLSGTVTFSLVPVDTSYTASAYSSGAGQGRRHRHFDRGSEGPDLRCANPSHLQR